MPYRSKQELPDSVQHVLPAHAQEIYKEAFNSAWDQYKIKTTGAMTPAGKRRRIRSPGRR
jgi:cation transport regulator ChaB